MSNAPERVSTTTLPLTGNDETTVTWVVLYDDSHWPWYKRLWRCLTRRNSRIIATWNADDE